MGRLRRLIHLSRGAITGAVDAVRRRAGTRFTSVRERLRAGGLGMNPIAARDGGLVDGDAGGSSRAAGPFHTRSAGAESADPGQDAVTAGAPGRGAAAPQQGGPRGAAQEAVEQPRHVALVVPPGHGGEPVKPAAPTPAEAANIPWGYGKDRVTAAAVDPNRLYVYWEVTDEAIARARDALGAAGEDAWLNLRAYDTTGILFDGTNAPHHFDHGIGRSERQWFFDIRRPTSTVVVEVGLHARDGGFVRIARSSRVDFPRAEPAPWAEPEWMSVVAATGDARPAGWGMPSQGGAVPGPQGQAFQGGASAAAAPSFVPIPLWIIHDAAGHATWVRELTEAGWERVEWREVHGEHWFEMLGRVEWEGPRTFSTWEAGPFTYPVEVHEPTREEWHGHSVAYRIGEVTRVVHGPWQVVIRNLGAHVSRAVLGRWQIHRSWVAEGGREVRSAGRGAVPLGASEALVGASERAWAFGSEVRLGGASEVWRFGASEVRLGGASERLYAGASQWLLRGASEQRLGGASEWRFRGASEQLRRGASERLFAGASERGGASERLFAGASERGGASERLFAGASERGGASEGRLAGGEERESARQPGAAVYPKPE
jgi:hypothetical protein